MLHIDDVSYRYQSRDTWTLKHIDLKMEQGEMVLLAGRSGCGKSTLIKIISGLVSEDGQGTLKGRILLDGQDITFWPPEKIGLLAGTVYQSPDDQLFAMTVEDEAGFALENQGEEPETEPGDRCSDPYECWYYGYCHSPRREQLSRIARNETHLNALRRALSRPGAGPQELSSVRERAEALSRYLESEDWKQDFADDEAGLLPGWLRRGVLSEDGIYNVLEEYGERMGMR